MNCPKCGNKTIKFSEWKRAAHALRWTCPHCDAELKANKMVVIPMIICAIVIIGVCIAGGVLLGELKGLNKLAIFAVAFMVVAPLGALSWFKGGYIEKS